MRTGSVSFPYNISFEHFKYEREDEIGFSYVMNVVNNKLNFYYYIFLIRIEEEYEENKLKACYHYYLFPTEIFKINEIEKINFNDHRRKASLSSKCWTFCSFNGFY